MSSETFRKTAILIFSKSAELGRVKTRLLPRLTETECLDLHLALLRDAIAKARGGQADVALYLSGNAPLPFDPGIPVVPQQGADLGERMLNAFTEQLADHEKVLIIGTDSPTFPVTAFADAFRLLEDHEIVLGPADDGGYYLIGLSKLTAKIFTGIDWSTDRVLHQTLAAAAGNRLALLPSCYDIDTPEDLQRLRNEMNRDTAHWKNTAQWLQRNSW